MLKPWRAWERCELDAVEWEEFSESTRSLLLSHTIELVALGFVPAGDYQLRIEDESLATRYFQSSDGAVLGCVSDRAAAKDAFGLVSILEDGTCVKSTPQDPHAPWSCCRFPVYVNFGAGCGAEDLLVMHLTTLAELEHGCGPTQKYAPGQVPEIVAYLRALEHETEHGLGAPPEALPEVPAPAMRQLVTH